VITVIIGFSPARDPHAHVVDRRRTLLQLQLIGRLVRSAHIRIAILARAKAANTPSERREFAVCAAARSQVAKLQQVRETSVE
jgi:hypothetical protein